MKKMLIIIICLMLMLSMFLTSCKQDSSETNEEIKETKSEEKVSKTEDSKDADQKDSKEETETEPDGSFIADRTITIKTFQKGIPLPEDQINNVVAQKIKELTGITYEIEVMNSADELQELTLALSSGDLPDMITGFVQGGGSELIRILAKAARDGLFTDLKPMLEKSNKYKRFLDEDYLTKDAIRNIVMRPDFDGSIYLLHMEIPRENVPSSIAEFGTGLYCRGDIADALNVDLSTIKTHDDLYDLVVKIKEGEFKDGKGKDITPIGPYIWGGYNSSIYFPNLDFGGTSNFNKNEAGEIVHVAMTDYSIEAIEWSRKLLEEGLMHKETYTMQNAQAVEAFSNGSFAIMGMHAFSQAWDNGNEVLREKNPEMMYRPVGPMLNYAGSTERLVRRSGSFFLAVPESTKNPEEIMAFADWCASGEGRRLIKHGIEGEHYTLTERVFKEYEKYTTADADDDGMDIVLTEEQTEKINEDPNYATNQGIAVRPLVTLATVDTYHDWLSGSLGLPEYDYCREMLKLATLDSRVIDGITARAAIAFFEGIDRLKPVLDSYGDTFTSACFADDMDEAIAIMDSYKEQLIKAGLDDAIQYFLDFEDENPGMLIYYTKP